MRRISALIATILLLSAGAAYGKACNDVNFPDQAKTGGGTLTLNGLGIRKATMLKVKVYVAALYLTKTSKDANAILAANAANQLSLHFVRNVSAADLSKAWDEGFAKNAKAQLPALKKRIATLNGWMGDMKTGEILTFTFQPGVGVQVTVGSAVKGTVPGDDFGKALLSIWLGAEPPNPEIKTGLLGGACA